MQLTIKDLAAQLMRANLRSQEAHQVVLLRILGERDRLKPIDVHLAGCLHAAAVLVRSIPNLDEESGEDVKQLAGRVIRSVAAALVKHPSFLPDGEFSDAVGTSTLKDMVLGEVMVQLGVVAEQDVSDALRVMQVSGKRLGETLIEMGLASEFDVRNALALKSVVGPPERARRAERSDSTAARTNTTLSLGEIMLKNRVVDEAQIEEALKLPCEKSMRIGEALVSIGAATWTDVTDAVQDQVQRRAGNGVRRNAR